MTEKWLPVLGYESCYQVSDHGHVRSVDRVRRGRSDGLRVVKGKILRTHPNNKGYLLATLYDIGHKRKLLVHRLVLLAFVGSPPPGTEACHKDGDQTRNVLSNLRWGTPGSNNRDKRDHGTMWQLDRAHCPEGHPYLPGNLVPSALAKGGRTCLACSRGRATIQYARRKGYVHGTLAQESAKYYEELARIHSLPPLTTGAYDTE